VIPKTRRINKTRSKVIIKTEKKNTDSNESHQSTNKNKSYLNNFSSEKIEYVRVWYQLISTKNDLKGIRNVYVTKIPKGSK